MEKSFSGAAAPAAAGPAFEEIFEEHRGSVWGYVLKLTRDSHAADDLCQEVFFRAYKRLHTLEIRGKVRSWLLSIGYHAAVDWMRRNSSESRLKRIMDGRSRSRGAWPSPEEKAIREEEIRRARNLCAATREKIARLPPHYREVIEMRFFEGLSLSRIAELTRSPVGNVKVRLHRARKRLAREMEDEGIFFHEIP